MSGYTLVKEIGKGGMGNIYEGISATGRRIAVKMMSCKITNNPEFRELFYSEAASLKKMHNPYVVNVVGEPFADEQGNLYLPMEFVEGETMEQRVRKQGAYTESDARVLLGEILEAFAYIHSMGCIHRDIKPSNIMIRPNGKICVIDFGIAKDMKTSTGKTIGRIIGTDGYMSPEQAKGDSVDYRTDIYSLGCLLHFMLTGQHAILKKSNDYATICSILQDEFPRAKDLNPQISAHIQEVILKAVDKNMLHRFQTVMEFKVALCGEPSEEIKTEIIPDKISVTVGRKGCDIIINGEYISGCHLEIEYREEILTGSTRSFLLLTDKSTNGTSVDGRYLHHGNIELPFSFQRQYELPDIFLAAREEYLLNWRDVIQRLKEKSGQEEQYETVSSHELPESLTCRTVKLSTGYGILSFLFPIVGWFFWLQWKSVTPDRARIAARLAWGGFILGMIMNFFYRL